MPDYGHGVPIVTRLLRRAERLPSGQAVGLAVLLVAVVGSVDFVTGGDLAFSPFYLVAVLLASTSESRIARVGTAFAASLAWVGSDVLNRVEGYTHVLVPVWNTSARFLVFWLVGLLAYSLRSLLQHEQRLARTDALTGLANGRSFYERARNELVRQQRFRQPLTLAYFDVDNFKTVNDTLGHEIGDDVLREVAETLLERLRLTDVAARLGGDEFAVLLPDTDADGARQALGDVRSSLMAVAAARRWPISFSVGAVTWVSSASDVEDMVKRADRLMYEVKRSGKDNVRFETVDPQAIPTNLNSVISLTL